MDQKLMDMIHDDVPQFNEKIAAGYAATQLGNVDLYIDRVIRCAQVRYPEGLKYEGYARVPPRQAFDILTGGKNNRNSVLWDISRSDFYLVKYQFSFKPAHGERVMLKPRYLYLPFVNDSAMMYIGGSIFYIKPILADPIISTGMDFVFIPLNSTRITWFRRAYYCVINGLRKSSSIIYGLIHHSLKKEHKAGNKSALARITSNAHYLFTQSGVTKAFADYCNVKLIHGKEDINPLDYNPDSWTIFQSTGVKPDWCKNKDYKTHGIRFAMRNEDVNEHTISMIASIYYVLDTYPHEIMDDSLDDPLWWQLMLGYFIFSDTDPKSHLLDRVKEHLVSVGGYIDEMAIELLESENIHVSNMYEFLYYLVCNFNELIVNQGANVGSLYNKRLTVTRYVLQEIVARIFKTFFSINQSKKKDLTVMQIERELMRAFNTREISNIKRNGKFVSSPSSPSDCRMFKITSEILPQSDASPGKKVMTPAVLKDEQLQLNISFAEVGSFAHLSKSEAIGRNRISFFANVRPDGLVVPDPSRAPLIAKTARMISRVVNKQGD